MEYRTLGNTGLRVSVLGFGASPLGDEFHKIDEEEGTRAVHRALDLGINYFDVAPYYGRTLAEERLGRALSGRRESAVLATKCGRYDVATFDFSRESVHASCDASLRRLRTDWIDVFQAHDIEFGEASQVIHETIPAMRELQRQGKVRFVGITGLPVLNLRRVAGAAPVDTVLSYCRYNLLSDDLERLMGEFAEHNGIGLINASPLAMGILTNQGPPAWHPAPQELKAAGARLAQVCREHGTDIASVALRYAIEYPRAATTLAGMATTEHVDRNVHAAATPNDPELLSLLRKEAGPAFGLTWMCGRPENNDGELERNIAGSRLTI